MEWQLLDDSKLNHDTLICEVFERGKGIQQ